MCIVELKNVPVDTTVLLQVLRYAFWAEMNLDTVRLFALESSRAGDGTKVSDSPEVRIIIAGPSIERQTLLLSGRIDYEIDLLEVRRWRADGQEFVHVAFLEEELPRTGRARAGSDYDRERYEEMHEPAAVECFIAAVAEVDRIVVAHGWSLERRFRKDYCSWKLDGRVLFGVHWMGPRRSAFFFKLPPEEMEALRPASYPMWRYDRGFKQGYFEVDCVKPDAEHLRQLFAAAFQRRQAGN